MNQTQKKQLTAAIREELASPSWVVDDLGPHSHQVRYILRRSLSMCPTGEGEVPSPKEGGFDAYHFREDEREKLKFYIAAKQAETIVEMIEQSELNAEVQRRRRAATSDSKMNVMEADSFAYINRAYDLKVAKGARVEYTGGYSAHSGTIVSAEGGRLRIRLDGQRHSGLYHPTWELRHLPPEEQKHD